MEKKGEIEFPWLFYLGISLMAIGILFLVLPIIIWTFISYVPEAYQDTSFIGLTYVGTMIMLVAGGMLLCFKTFNIRLPVDEHSDAEYPFVFGQNPSINQRNRKIRGERYQSYSNFPKLT